MTAYAWLIYAAIILALALLPLTYIVQDWAARNVARHVDLALAPLTVTDDDFPEYAADPDPFDWSADALATYAKWESSRDLADPFAMTRAEIAALETTEEHR